MKTKHKKKLQRERRRKINLGIIENPNFHKIPQEIIDSLKQKILKK